MRPLWPFAILVATTGCSLLVSTSGLHDSDSTEPADAGLQTDGPSSTEDAATDQGDARQNGTSVYANAIRSDNPLAFWRLDETSGIIARDDIGNAHPGAYVGTITHERGVFSGSTAAVFDGTSSAIDVGRFFAFTGKAPYSVEAWVKPAVVNAGVKWILSRNQEDLAMNAGAGEGYELYFGADYVLFQRNHGTGDGFAQSGSIVANQWAYVVGTFDGSVNRIYVNGELADEAGSSVSLTDPANSTLKWGNRANGAGPFVGSLDELAIYDVALAPERITAHFNAAR